MSARWARFRPILAGARLQDRMLACAGALAAISVTAVIGVLVEGPGVLPFIVAPVGASAVLVFAVARHHPGRRARQPAEGTGPAARARHPCRCSTTTGSSWGTVGLRELVRQATNVGSLASTPSTALAELPLAALSLALTDGHAHAVVIVDDAGGLHGMVTQTDLLVALCRALTDPA